MLDNPKTYQTALSDGETLGSAGAGYSISENRRPYGPGWGSWVAASRQTPREGAARLQPIYRLGEVSPRILTALAARGIAVAPGTEGVLMSQDALRHTLRDSKVERGTALVDADLARLPDIINSPMAVLLDTEASRGGLYSLLYVFNPAEPRVGRERGKVVVRVGYSGRFNVSGRGRETIFGNFVRTAGYVKSENLKRRNYKVLEGKLE